MMTTDRIRPARALALAATLMIPLVLGACSDETAAPGHITIQLVDAPYPFDAIDTAEIGVQGIEIRLHQDAGESGYLALPVTPDTLNLLELANGVAAMVCDTEVPAGRIDQVRLILDHASVTLTDTRTFDLDVPSGESSGLKVFLEPDLVVPSGGSVDLLVDVDVSGSFKSLPASAQRVDEITGFQFDPVLRVVVLESTATVSGTTLTDAGTPDVPGDDAPLTRVAVSAWKDGELITTTMSDAGGGWAILGLPAGTVLVRGEAPGHAPAVTTVDVAAGQSVGTELVLPKL
jgi:hypothetical protein